jgi:hypothetical protein
MKAVLISSLLALSVVSARPVNQRTLFTKREVPQEHSHQQFITTVTTSLRANNPNGIVDPIFSLLGNAVRSSPLSLSSLSHLPPH